MEQRVLPAADNALLQRIRVGIPGADMRRVESALLYARELYGSRRCDLLPFGLLEHTYGVVDIALEFCPDEDGIIACLLQHALERKDVGLDDLENRFGPSIRKIVGDLHLLSHVHSGDRRQSIHDLRKMLVSVSDDVRVVLLKLCIRCFALDHLSQVTESERQRLSRESLQLFAPVAARLGVYVLKHRLEQKAFPIVYPVEHDNIVGQIASLREKHGSFLKGAIEELRRFFAGEGLRADIDGREKLPYSIFIKQRAKGVTDIEEIHDLFALRVFVDTEADCYQALGLLHRLGTPHSHRFKDYISFPKPNGYQSLHTCLIHLPGVPPDVKVEVQIRTHAMHREAEYGVAAHWQYKEGKGIRKAVASIGRSMRGKQLLSSLKGEEGGDSDAEHDQFASRIYVLTPKGEIIELPEDATPLDFAFAIHSDVGIAFRAARVNGTIVPVGHKLENGDVVEILTYKQPRPSFNWLDEVRTSGARSKIRAYFALRERDTFIARGRDLINAECKYRSLPPLDPDFSMLKTFDGKPLSIREREDLLVKVGQGSVKAASVLRHLKLPIVLSPKTQPRRERTSRREHIVEVEGGLAMPVRFAKCCNAHLHPSRPPIVGFITRTGEVSIHRKECGMLRNANPARITDVRWAEGEA